MDNDKLKDYLISNNKISEYEYNQWLKIRLLKDLSSKGFSEDDSDKLSEGKTLTIYNRLATQVSIKGDLLFYRTKIGNDEWSQWSDLDNDKLSEFINNNYKNKE